METLTFGIECKRCGGWVASIKRTLGCYEGLL